jgi:hypothetical protein
VDESPEVSFYVLNEPALTAQEPDDIAIWQELAHLRTENFQWRECVQGILGDVEQHRTSTHSLTAAIEKRVAALAQRLSARDHR